MPEELIEQWTLLPRDLALLANKAGPTRLGFSVLLLYFQREGRFPEHRRRRAAPRRRPRGGAGRRAV